MLKTTIYYSIFKNTYNIYLLNKVNTKKLLIIFTY